MSSGDHIRKIIGERFEPAGQGFLYRETERAPGVPVSVAERRALEAELDRRIHRLGVLADGRVQVVAALAVALVAGYFGAPVLLQGGIFFGILLSIVVLMLRLEKVLLKRLEGRAPVDNGLTRRESFIRAVAKKTRTQMLRCLFISSVGVANMYLHKYDTTSLLISRAIFTVTGVLAIGYTLVELGTKIWLTSNEADRR